VIFIFKALRKAGSDYKTSKMKCGDPGSQGKRCKRKFE
jgi:hypothetical protein